MTAHMIYIPLDKEALNRWIGERGLIGRNTLDEGLALHVLLSGMFGKARLQPFRLFSSERRRQATLYAYSDADSAELKRMAEDVAPPDCLKVIKPQKLQSKPMRTEYSKDQRLGFDVRVRPVRRLRQELAFPGSGANARPGAEIDAYFVAVSRQNPDGPDNNGQTGPTLLARKEVYLDWLAERLQDTAEIDRAACRLVSFRRNRVLRGDGPGPEGPDVTIQGDLVVSEPNEFAARIHKGIGRHKAYGYGMLLLRPPSRSG